jgi:hypothetical protein
MGNRCIQVCHIYQNKDCRELMEHKRQLIKLRNRSGGATETLGKAELQAVPRKKS